jgi:alkylhydroperoxidase family enzyme
MTDAWLPGFEADDSLAAAVARALPQLAQRRQRLDARAWSNASVPATLLELARLRMAQLLGAARGRPGGELELRTAAVAAGLDADKAAHVSSWPTDPRFTEAERAGLGLAEQFLIDAKGVRDEDVAAVRDALGDRGAVAFTVALALLEGELRAAAMLGLVTKQAT